MKVVLGLLELAAPAERLLPGGPIQFPLSGPADAARTARHALLLIATARPPAFITALSKEVARSNAAAASAGLHHSQSPLVLPQPTPSPRRRMGCTDLMQVKARSEILRLIEVLIEKQHAHVLQLLLPVGEVLVHCLDTSLLKSSSAGLGDVFKPIAKLAPSLLFCWLN